MRGLRWSRVRGAPVVAGVIGVYHDAELCRVCDGTGEVVVGEDVCCGDPGCACRAQAYRTLGTCQACGGEG